MNSTIERLGTEKQSALCEVEAAELSAISGGYDDGNWCGTPWRRIPLPRPMVDGLLDKVSPVVLNGMALGR